MIRPMGSLLTFWEKLCHWKNASGISPPMGKPVLAAIRRLKRSPSSAMRRSPINPPQSWQKRVISCRPSASMVAAVQAKLERIDCLIAEADGVVLPGVGAFGACMDALRAAGLEGPTHDAVASGRPFLGICMGLQVLFDHSEEHDTPCLGLVPGEVRRLPVEATEGARLSIPKAAKSSSLGGKSGKDSITGHWTRRLRASG